jgi:agmatinase
VSDAPPRNFLGLSPEDSAFESSGVVVLPVPYEATTSYLGGTRNGPQAILDASRAIELYDHAADDEPYRIGVHTAAAPALSAAGPEAALEQLRQAYARLAATGKFIVLLGGEHSVSVAPIREWAARLRRRRRSLSVLQLDAHGDLREEWEGTPYSHACAMRRVVDQVRLVQVGIRAVAAEERAVMREHRVTTVFAEELDRSEKWMSRALARLGRDVYVTIDVDFFDPSLVPSTGTPEPGGGGWYAALRLLERVFRTRNVVAADVVELAPIPGLAAPDFLVAKLVYKLIGFHRTHGRTAGKR